MQNEMITQWSSNEDDSSAGGSVAGTEYSFDYTSEFTTDEVFKSRDELVEWIRERGNSNGLVIIIKNSDIGVGKSKKPRIKFGCERGGAYRRKVDESVHKRRRRSGSKKCGCPFLLKGVTWGDDNEWKLEVICGVHNHHAEKSNVKRFSEEEKALLVDITKSLAKPKDILRTIKQKDGLEETTMKTIYNVRQRLRVQETVVRSQMHGLLSKLSEHNYIEWHRSSEDNIVKDLFWTHPVSADVLRAFPRVLIMDCTCKAYSLPLLEIVGVTCTDITFSAAFACLDSKNEDNYIWALSRLKTMLDEQCLPMVIVTEKDVALMNAIHTIFPSAQNLLCRSHISKDVLAKCKDMIEGKGQLEKFMMSWNMLVLSDTELEYARRMGELDYYFSKYPHALDYVKNTWLNEYKKRFVSVWADMCMHLGHTTLNRMEGACAKLTQILNGRSSFETSWGKIHSLLEMQHMDIKSSLEKCLTIIPHNFMHDQLKELRGFVSTIALSAIVSESKKVNSVGVDSSSCGCTIRRTHGLPCVHEIAECRELSRPIPLYCVDPHWRKLDLYSPKSSSQAADVITQMHRILNRWMDSDEDSRGRISLKLEEIMNMEWMPRTRTKGQPGGTVTTTHCNLSAFEFALSCQDNHSPGDSVETVTTVSLPEEPNRRPPKMKVQRMFPLTSAAFKEQFPTALRPYISSARDFAGDGNCGYRVIAALMGFGDGAWSKVRRELLNELCAHETHYENLFGTRDRVKELMHTLSFFEESPPSDRWLTMPDMGHIIASSYNVVVIYLSVSECFTFLPTRTVSVPLLERRHIGIGSVNDDHFFQVFLFAGHPVPPVSECWYRVRQPGAEGWESVYKERIIHFTQIVGPDSDLAAGENLLFH